MFLSDLIESICRVYYLQDIYHVLANMHIIGIQMRIGRAIEDITLA